MNEAKKKNVLAVWEICRQVSLVYYDKTEAALEGNHFNHWLQQARFPICPLDLEPDNVDFEN